MTSRNDTSTRAGSAGRPLRVLVACERSGQVRRAFRALGHDAWSCDIEPADDSQQFHLKGNALGVIAWGAPGRGDWDLMVACPPCTDLCNSGARWWKLKGAEKQEAALEFVRALMNAPIPLIAIENPPGKIGTAIRPADQYVQPWQFGHLETKKTGLWLKGLPLLKPTRNVYDSMMNLTIAERSRVHWMPPGPERARKRSETYAGLAKAMAEQWSGFVQQTQLEAA
jgi:hypothetical protein